MVFYKYLHLLKYFTLMNVTLYSCIFDLWFPLYTMADTCEHTGLRAGTSTLSRAPRPHHWYDVLYYYMEMGGVANLFTKNQDRNFYYYYSSCHLL